MTVAGRQSGPWAGQGRTFLWCLCISALLHVALAGVLSVVAWPGQAIKPPRASAHEGAAGRHVVTLRLYEPQEQAEEPHQLRHGQASNRPAEAPAVPAQQQTQAHDAAKVAVAAARALAKAADAAEEAARQFARAFESAIERAEPAQKAEPAELVAAPDAPRPERPPPSEASEQEADTQTPAQPQAKPQPSQPLQPDQSSQTLAAAGASAETPTNPAAKAQALPAPAGSQVSSARAARPIRPAYPPTAVRRRQEGLVIVEAQVSAEGSVSSARVIRSSGHDSLDAAALRAVREAWFSPAHERGSPVASTVQVPVRFRLR